MAETSSVTGQQRPTPWRRSWFRTVALIVSVLVAGFWTWRWLSAIGGPTALADRYGALAPLVSIPVHVVLAATPFPSEIVGVANGSIYGLWAGTLYGWVAWWSAGMLVYALARRGADGIDEAALAGRVPSWLKRFPVEHPAFLIVGRQLPFAFHAINVMSAIGGVSPRRQMLTSAISNLIYAFLAAAAGTGLVSVGGPGR